MQGPWSYDVPEGWRVRPLWSEFRRVKTLGDGSEELLSVYRDYGVIRKSSREDNFNKPSEDLSKYQRVSVGDLVVNKMKAWQGSLGVSIHEGIVSPAYFVFKATGNFDGRFAHYLLRSKDYVDHMGAISSGIRPNQWDLDPAQFAVTPLLAPPPAEQRAIVDYLDRETAQIDAFIAKNEKVMSLLTERRAAVIAGAVKRGLDAAVSLRSSGVEWLGQVPSHWPVQRLASTVLRTRSGVWGADPQGDENDLRCVRVADFDRSSQRVHDSAYTIRNVTASERAGRVLKKGDLLLEKSGGGEKSPVGFVVLYDRDEPAVCSNFVARVQLQDNMDSAFWTYVHGVMYRSRLTERSTKQSTGIQNLDQNAYFNEYVPVPPYREQQAIAKYLKIRLAEFDDTIKTARRGVDLARERRKALIAAAVTGKIDLGIVT